MARHFSTEHWELNIMEQCPQYFEENDFQANILYPATVSIRYEGRIKTFSVRQYLKKLYLIYPLTKSY